MNKSMKFAILFASSLMNSCQTTETNSVNGPIRTIIICEQKQPNSSLQLIGVSRSERPEIIDVRYRKTAESGIRGDEQATELFIENFDGAGKMRLVANDDEPNLRSLTLSATTSAISLHTEGETPLECNLHQVLDKDPAQRKATCSGIGTPAQGWYVSGKLLQYDRKCHATDMRCSFPQSQAERWVIYNRPFPSEINLEKCAGQKDCKVSNELFELSPVNKILASKCGRIQKSQVASSK